MGNAVDITGARNAFVLFPATSPPARVATVLVSPFSFPESRVPVVVLRKYAETVLNMRTNLQVNIAP
jgi:hypothetical protein